MTYTDKVELTNTIMHGVELSFEQIEFLQLLMQALQNSGIPASETFGILADTLCNFYQPNKKWTCGSREQWQSEIEKARAQYDNFVDWFAALIVDTYEGADEAKRAAR